MRRVIRRGKNLEQLVGENFGQLTVQSLIWEQRKNGKRRRKARCICSCGTIRDYAISELERGDTRSCGCLRKKIIFDRCFEDLTNKTYGKLLVVEYAGPHRRGGSQWKSECLCGKTSTVKATRLKSGTTTSCGCYQKCRGSEHWNYDHSKSLIERENSKRGKIKDILYDDWRKAVFMRDNYTCQLTGIKGGDLVSHHLYSWNTHKELRYIVDNGITISTILHNKFHKIYGRGNNTPEQFNEFRNILTCTSCEA